MKIETEHYVATDWGEQGWSVEFKGGGRINLTMEPDLPDGLCYVIDDEVENDVLTDEQYQQVDNLLAYLNGWPVAIEGECQWVNP